MNTNSTLTKQKIGSIVTVVMLIMTVVTELSMGYGDVMIGVVLSYIVLLSLLLMIFMKIAEDIQPLLVALLLIPLIRILSSSFPLHGIPEYVGHVIISIPVCIAGVTAAKSSGFSIQELGFRFDGLHVPLLIGLSGIPLGFAAFFLMEPSALPSNGPSGGTAIWWVVLIFYIGLIEEWIYRGVILNTLVKQHGERKAIYYTSLLYAAMMISGKSLWYVVFAFLVSVLFCMLFLRFRSIPGLSLAHGFINVVIGLPAQSVFGWTAGQGAIPVNTLLTESTELHARMHPTSAIAYDLFGILLLIGLLIWIEILRAASASADTDQTWNKNSRCSALSIPVYPLFYLFCYVVIYQIFNVGLFMR